MVSDFYGRNRNRNSGLKTDVREETFTKSFTHIIVGKLYISSRISSLENFTSVHAYHCCETLHHFTQIVAKPYISSRISLLRNFTSFYANRCETLHHFTQIVAKPYIILRKSLRNIYLEKMYLLFSNNLIQIVCKNNYNFRLHQK
jgi:hypothetical protein